MTRQGMYTGEYFGTNTRHRMINRTCCQTVISEICWNTIHSRIYWRKRPSGIGYHRISCITQLRMYEEMYSTVEYLNRERWTYIAICRIRMNNIICIYVDTKSLAECVEKEWMHSGLCLQSIRRGYMPAQNVWQNMFAQNAQRNICTHTGQQSTIGWHSVLCWHVRTAEIHLSA